MTITVGILNKFLISLLKARGLTIRNTMDTMKVMADQNSETLFMYICVREND